MNSRFIPLEDSKRDKLTNAMKALVQNDAFKVYADRLRDLLREVDVQNRKKDNENRRTEAQAYEMQLEVIDELTGKIPQREIPLGTT